MGKLELVALFGVEFVFLLTTMNVAALNSDQMFEGTCEELQNVTQSNIDLNWFGSIQDWYVPAGSKRHLYLMTRRMFNYNQTALQSIPDHRLYYEACFTYQSNETSVGSVRGFEPGLVSYVNTSMPGEGIIDFMSIRQDGGAEESTRNHISLTDNRSFVFLTSCELQENIKSWALLTPEPELSDETVSIIEKHAVEQGFDPEQFAILRYDSCQPGVARDCPGRGGGRPWGKSHHHHGGPPKGFRGRGRGPLRYHNGEMGGRPW
ncbi:unnamed protein product [Orchesella dallaii]|uniref:Uncharacterized protein n=1 Tax=Orchesella dallaii TaxID=48710 RepID=A0ABP1R266_9HEXA